MRDYLYISDAKVDAYLGQIKVAEKKKLAAQIGINVGILQASVGAEAFSPENRVKRLGAVEKKIRKVHSVGTIESNDPWIDDTTPVVAASFPDNPDVMFFFSSTPAYFLGLAGSAHHIIGNVPSATATSSYSHLHSLISNLRRIDTAPWAFVVDKADDAVAREVHLGISQPAKVSSWTTIMSMISGAKQIEGEPEQSISFLARRLTSDAYGLDGRRYILATPLYIATTFDQ